MDTLNETRILGLYLLATQARRKASSTFPYDCLPLLRARMFAIESGGFLTREQVNFFYSLVDISLAQTTSC